MKNIDNRLTLDQNLVTKMPYLSGTDIEVKRQEIREYFHKTFSLDEELFKCLKDDENYYMKGSPLRHPLIFYYGHTATFYINKLFIAGLIPKRINEGFEAKFAIGVDEMSWDHLDMSDKSWPSVNDVKKYRDEVREVVDQFILEAELTLPIEWNDPFWIVNMAIEHERIHIETSSVLIRELPISAVQPNPLFKVCKEDTQPPENTFITVPQANIQLGRSHENPFYGWDNEYGAREYAVKEFQASQFLVSHKEYYAFMLDNGYHRKELWTEEGWSWRSYQNTTHPHFWVESGETYLYRTMTEEIKMPWSWPVDINYHEAKAFCNWKSISTEQSVRMPTEAEWMVLRNRVETDQPIWDKAPGNVNLEYWSSACPVNTFSQSGGFYDIIGNVWQWTETPIAAFPGFQVHPMYDDFSVPTFDQKHNIIKGGSYFSTGNYALKSSRYAFRKHFFQHAGLRYIMTDEPIHIDPVNPYETDDLINQYMEFQYGDRYFDVENFAKACATICIEESKAGPKKKALDLGCAVGRLTFELAKEFDFVQGVDYSARFIATAVDLQKNATKKYTAPIEGELLEFKEASLEKLGLLESAQNCSFMQGDACNFDSKYTDYDLVFAGNLIDRLYSPIQFLKSIHSRLTPGGILVLTSPYTWLEEYTPKDEWLGGIKKSGENQRTINGLKEALSEHFDFVKTQDVPFVIRETARKFQHTIAELSVWKLKF